MGPCAVEGAERTALTAPCRAGTIATTGEEGRVAVTENRRAAAAGARWDRAHARRAQSATIARIYRDVYGADFFDDGTPNAFYYATLTDLRRIVGELRVGPGQSVADLGCGTGAPTVWVARETGANLVGIDLSSVGLEHARRRTNEWQLDDRVQFVRADLRATGLDGSSFDGAMSLDALDTIPRADDRAEALREAARLLRPGARFVHSNWESSAPSSTHQPPRDAVSDYRPMLRQAGFEIETYEETPDWQARDRAVLERTIEAEADLREELGYEAAMAMVQLQRGWLEEIERRRRIFVVARRKLSPSDVDGRPSSGSDMAGGSG